MRGSLKPLGALAAVSALACTFVAGANAGVLVVDPSGQGDSTTIQGAVTLAAEGDTIRIRAGTYTESTQYPFPWATWETYVAIDKDNLTFIGDSRDSVIIGPPTANFNYTTMEPKGFVSSGLFRLTIRNVTVRNCYDGFNADGNLDGEPLLGVPDSQSIADVVWDMNDDPTIKAIVDFVPFSLTSVPVQRSSMGSIKAHFADPR